MSNGFLRALAKVKLVELEEDATPSKAKPATPSTPDVGRVSAPPGQTAAGQGQSRVTAPRQTPPPPPPQRTNPSPNVTITDGVPFDEYYAAASVPMAMYPAEKLLRVLDGLRAMDPATRRAAVLAMDAADDSWTIADVVLDAGQKRQALHEAVTSVEARMKQTESHAAQEKATRDAYLAEAASTIRRKIAELEQALQNEITDIAEQKSKIEQASHDAMLAGQREITRLNEEATRLREIESIFGEG